MGLGFYLGRVGRNENHLLEDPRPIPEYGNCVHTGNPALDGFTLLSRAQPDRQGSPPNVSGTKPQYELRGRGPDDSFEQ